MNIKELNRDRQLCILTDQPLCETNKKIDKFFNELFNGMSIREIDDTIYFSKNEDYVETIYMKLDNKNKKMMYVSRNKIWSILINNIGLSYSDSHSLIQNIIREKYNIKIPIPVWIK